MIYRNLMVLPNINTSRITFYNCAISFNNNNTFHLVNKLIFHSVQWMHYTTNSKNTKCSDTTGNNKIQNLSTCLYTEDVDSESDGTSLQNSSQKLNHKYRDLYLKNHEIAKTFVNLIKDDLLKNMSHVFELNPGFGFITEELLRIGVPLVNLLESNPEFSEQLHDLNKRFPDRLSFKQLDLFNMSKMLNQDSEGNSKIYKLLDSMQLKKWEEESCMQIIGATMKSNFIKHLIISTVFQSGLMMYGRPTIYLAIPPSICNKFCVNKKSKTFYVMFNILFNYQIFGRVDRKAFIPRPRFNYKRRKDVSDLYVIKIEPKPDLFALFKTKKDLIFFWHFVRHNVHKSSTRVIPSLERIVPNCGIKLIAKNYNIFTTFGDLTPNQIYELFLELQSWPEYDGSTFVLSANDIKKSYDLYLEEE